MITVYYSIYDSSRSNTDSLREVERLAEAIHSRCRRYIRDKDRYRCILGKLLLLECLDGLGLSGQTLINQWRTDVHGRPWICDGLDCTLSHTDGFVVCAVATAPIRIGIDVERIRPVKIEDFAQVFSQDLITRMTDNPEPYSTFFRHWTAAESALKADGRGFSVELDRFSVDLDKGTAVIDETGWHLFPIPINPNFTCSLAASSDQVKLDIRGSTRYAML